MIGLVPKNTLRAETHDKGRDASKDGESLKAFLRDPKSVPPSSLAFVPTATVCDLVEGLSSSLGGEKKRVSVRVRLQGKPWEIGLEPIGRDFLASLYQGGPIPLVEVAQRRVDGAAFIGALERVLAERSLSVQARTKAALDYARHAMRAHEAEVELETVTVDPGIGKPFALSADVVMRPATRAFQVDRGAPGSQRALSVRPNVMRADLVPLLCRGRLRVSAADDTREISEVLVYLVAEQLAELALAALEAQATQRPLFRRVEVGDALLAIRVERRGPTASSDKVRAVRPIGADGCSVSFGVTGDGARQQAFTFPCVDVGVFAESVVALGRALARTIVKHDRSQIHNLRLIEFRAKLREISDGMKERARDDAKLNLAPESYRAYAPRPVESPISVAPSRLRYELSWQAAVPAIDLRATFLCGDALVVTGARELCAIDRARGELRWRRPVGRAATVLTPCGVARFDQEGVLRLYDVATGESRWSLRLQPRVGAPVTGAVVASEPLGKLLILSEGKRHLTCVDLESGEIRWRHVCRRVGPFRLKRAGRLLFVTSGERALSALDVLTGEVVWRFCDRLRFATHVAVDGDSLFAVAGDGVGRGGARMHHLDPWSGALRFAIDLPHLPRVLGPPLASESTVSLATHGPQGTRLYGVDRHTGECSYDREVAPGVAAALVVDDVIVLNSESGVVVALEAKTGEVRYRNVLATTDGDRPRRLEPVLRSGALFVPQSSVFVLRPRDGSVLGSIQSDIIPDLLRVDERCHVYVAEESGHLSAYGAATKLSLVR